MADAPDLGRLYRDTRLRIADVVRQLTPEQQATPVPATPGWTVRDVVAHLLGVVEDGLAGNFPVGGPNDEWTAAQVARHPDDIQALLEQWEAEAAGMEAFLTESSFWPGALDIGCHEQDIRNALGLPRQSNETIHLAVPLVLGFIRTDAPLVIRTEHTEVRVGPEDGEPTVLATTEYEAFRWRFGRRSRSQVAAMDWSGDAEPFLDSLYIFGPAAADIVEPA
ncbi:MAG TPA: maleylpyruvate isomerase family mycothiol-dependent enzyme [Acidimicrobiales bacterium]